MPLGVFARWISNETGVSIVIEAGLDAQPVTVEILDQEVSTVLALVARRLGAQITRTRDVYYIGQLRSEDRGVMVRMVRRLRAEDIQVAISTMTSDVGTVKVFPDGLTLCSDRVEVLERIDDLLDRLEAAPAGAWVVQLYILDLSASEQAELGLDVEPALDIAATFARASSGFAVPADGAAIVASLTAVLRAARSERAGSVVATPMFLMTDGGTATMRQGQTFPIPQRTTSPEGTVTISGFTDSETGLTLTVSIRESSAEFIETSVVLQMAEVIGFVADERPITVDSNIDTKAILRAGGVYMIGSADRIAQRRTVDGITRTVATTDDESRTLQLWARVYRIAHPAADHPAERSGAGDPATE